LSVRVASSVSGTTILAIRRPDGAVMKVAASRSSSGIPRRASPTRTDPATVAMPTVMTENSSEPVARRLVDSSQAAARMTSVPPSPHRICVTATHALSALTVFGGPCCNARERRPHFPGGCPDDQ
jgi:hypothetical protein